ncbi:hypothetical protein OROGR_016333 [Orobanche gracilis]
MADDREGDEQLSGPPPPPVIPEEDRIYLSSQPDGVWWEDKRIVELIGRSFTDTYHEYVTCWSDASARQRDAMYHYFAFDVTFPELPCSIVSIDAMDISGEQHLDVRHDITKKRIDAHGNIIETRADTIGSSKMERPLQRYGGRLEHNETYCGSCYGAEAADDECCNTCDEVREAYRKKARALFNTNLIDQCKREFLIAQWTQQTPNAMYQYFLKMLPTPFTDIDEHTIQSN